LVTPEKLQRERAVFAAFIYDCIIVVPYFLVALQVGSLTLLGEVLRGVLLISVAIASWVTLHAAYELLKSAIPDLLDRTLPENQQIRINKVLARHYENFDALKWCQSRQSGSDTEVHLGLGFAPHIPFGDVARISKAVVDDIEASLPGSRVTVTPVLPD
jgi:divalent metal cation (Fe/Co/Zn/Cd) transporter